MAAIAVEAKRSVLPIVALVAALLSLLLPIIGTLVAVGFVCAAYSYATDPRAVKLARSAAIITGVVVALHLAGALLLMPVSVTGGASSPESTEQFTP